MSKKRMKKSRRALDLEEESPDEMLLDIQKVETGKNIRMNILIYGLLGVGKTRLLGSAQDCKYTSPMLLLDIDGGVLSLSGSDIDIFRPQNFGQIQEVYDFLRFDNDYYRSVGIDSITEVQRKLSMADILGTLQEDASYSNLDGHKPPDRYDWLSSGEQMRRFIRAFKELAYLPDHKRRIHVFFTALEKYDDDRQLVCPSLPGLLGVEIGASVDVLARMSIQRFRTSDGKRKRRRHLALREFMGGKDGDVKHLAKIRKGIERAKFPTELWKPTVNRLLRYWMGGE